MTSKKSMMWFRKEVTVIHYPVPQNKQARQPASQSVYNLFCIVSFLCYQSSLQHESVALSLPLLSLSSFIQAVQHFYQLNEDRLAIWVHIIVLQY